MSRSSFSLNSTSQEFSVRPEQISASGGVDAPILSIPVEFVFNPLGRFQNEDRGSFKILNIKAELKITEKNFKCGETTQLYSISVYDKSNYGLSFPFLLNAEIIDRIEKYRRENLQANLTITTLVGVYSNLTVQDKKGTIAERSYISSFETGTGSINFQIEQSHWISKLLPQLGNKSFKLIEIPTFNQVIPEEYEVSISEFEQANAYFIKGDYDKTVAHCRAAIDPFYSNKEKFEKLKEFVRSKSEFEWANKVLNATEEWLDKIIKATASFASKTHHAPSVGHFSRIEAEIVLMVTTSIIAYIGKIEYKQE